MKPLQNCLNHVAEICHECAPGYYLGRDYHCRARDFGCSQYSKGICVQCDSPFVLANDACYIDGCDTYDANGCKSCSDPYKLSSKVCRLDNCDKAEKGVCLRCSTNYIVRGGRCVPRDANCDNYDDSGFCTRCFNGYHTADGNCQKDIEGCSNYNPRGACTQCSVGYYLTQDNICRKVDPGCVYRKGSCVDCFSPFTFGNNGCSIVGCSQYNIDGCATCQSPFVLTQSKSCNIPNCLTLTSGSCSACQDGYLLKNDGTCLKKIPNCKTYDPSSYLCTDCIEGYFTSDSQLECRSKVAGCIYRGGKVSSCYKPFIYNGGSCKIVGCAAFDFTGCKQCTPPFQLAADGTCFIGNCQTLTPSGSGCGTCNNGYIVSASGACSRSIDNCDAYDGDSCRTCSKNYFLESTGDKCTQMKPGCIYNGGVCSSCRPPFAFKNAGCMI